VFTSTQPAQDYTKHPDDHARALHPALSPGLVTVALRDTGRWLQTAIRPADLPLYVRELEGRADVYLSQNRFGGRRSVARLLQLSALWADLDYYRVPALRDRHPWWVRDAALLALEDAGIPAPGLAIATGRGLCLLWRHSPIPRAALPRWRVCQQHIRAVLEPFGADGQALDAARVLRLIGTRNSKTGTLVEAVSPLAPVWPFDDLAAEILPATRAEVHSILQARARRRARGDGPRPAVALSAGTYWETVLSDLQRLRRVRWFGTLPPGQRDAWMFVAGVAASWLVPASSLRREVYELAREAASWTPAAAESSLVSVLARAYAAARGERLTWCGVDVDPRYRMRAETVVNWLGIHEDEQRRGGLRVLVSADVRRELATRREFESSHRRGEVQRTRDEYRQAVATAAADRRSQARELRAGGASWADVGRTLGISAEAARKLATR
jgi:hypothetical protein